jgi:PAS domain S-box-containing protein
MKRAAREIVCDASGASVDDRFLAVNLAFERMTGLTTAAVVGQTRCPEAVGKRTTCDHKEPSMPESTDSRNDSRSLPELPIQEFFNNSPIGSFTSTPEGRISSANAALVRIFGYENPDVLIASITDIATYVHADPADRQEFRRLLEEHGAVFNHECRFRRRDGAELWGP